MHSFATKYIVRIYILKNEIKEYMPVVMVQQTTAYSNRNVAILRLFNTCRIQNYDDQSVDAVPSWTRDFEYTTARIAEPFFPNSTDYTPDVKPQQEMFTGLHTYEVRGL